MANELPNLPDFLSGAVRDPADADLRSKVREVILHHAGDPDVAAEEVIELLTAERHVLPGCPPAGQILEDARAFAAKLVLSNLCVRLLRMIDTKVVTPETKGLRRWLNDYIDGRNHGPIGHSMLWPSGLPGLAAQLREWGFQPTPTRPPFVARNPTAGETVN